MSFFPERNIYANDEARKAWFSTFAIFALWWIFRLLTGLFERTHANAANAANAAGVATPFVGHRRLHRITTALRDIFISTFAVVVFSYLTNNITRNFNILLWVVLWVGFFWAIARAFGRFGDILMLLVIAGFILLWCFTLVHHEFLGFVRDD